MNQYKKGKIIYIVFVVLAFLWVLANTGKEHISPLQTTADLTGLVSYYDKTDRWLMAVADRKLYIADSNRQVQNVISFDKEDIFNYYVYDVHVDGDSAYVYGTDIHKGTSFLASEKVARIGANGKFEGYVFEKDYDLDDRMIHTNELDMAVEDGYVYFLNDGYGHITVWKIPCDGSGIGKEPEVAYDFTLPMEAVDGYFCLDEQKIYIQLMSGDIYAYDMQSGVTELLEGLQEFPEGIALDRSEAEQMVISNAYYIKGLLFYLSLLILGSAIIYVFYIFVRSESFARYKKVWIVVLFLLISIYVLTKHFIAAKEAVVTEKISSIADMTMMSLESYYKDVDTDFEDYHEELKLTENMEKNNFCSNYLDEVCKNQGTDMNLLIYAFVVNKNYDLFSLGSTEHSYYYGQKMDNIGEYIVYDTEEQGDDISNLAQLGKRLFGTTKESYVYKDALGSYYMEERLMYNQKGEMCLILDVGADEAAIVSDSIGQAARLVLNLAAILAFCWVFFECLGRYWDDIKNYLMAKEKRSISSRLRLGGFYFFLINILIHLDYVLLVMVTVDICGKKNPIELAAMMAIPITAYRIGTWGGSVIASTVINFLGERKSGYLSAFLSIVSYALMAYACVAKNIYILAVGKLLEGIFLESILYSLAEGLPYECEDEEEMVENITKIKDGAAGAVIISLMVGGLCSSFISYQAMYLVGAALSAVVLCMVPLLLRSSEEEREDSEEEEEASGNGWLAFIKPKTLIYLVMIVVIFALMMGFEDYLFPILAETSGLSDMDLSNMGILMNTAAFIGIESFLPDKKYSPLQMMIVAFAACGLFISLVSLNTSIIFAFVALILVNIIGRTIENYKTLELTRITDKYGYDSKEIQENYYAVEDGIKVLQAPVLGGLCAISVPACFAILGFLCAAVPGAYALIAGKEGKRKLLVK